MTQHELKTWPKFFEAILAGDKTADLRKDDRGFSVGDVLVLHEWEPQGQFYTGRKAVRRVTHILRHDPEAGCAATFGLRSEYVVLSLSPCAEQYAEEAVRRIHSYAPETAEEWADRLAADLSAFTD